MGFGFSLGGSSSHSGLVNKGDWQNLMNQLMGALGDMNAGQIGDAYNIFGGENGRNYLGGINDMMSGRAANDIMGSVQSQMGPQYLAQLDKLSQALNPALRGSGIRAQLGKDITTESNQNMANMLSGLRSNMFTQGLGMLGNAQTTQTGFNWQGLQGLRQILAQMAGTTESYGSGWNAGGQYNS
jgi:hypothetical protein